MIDKFNNWFLEVCLDIYDWYTTHMADFEAAILKEVEKAKQEFING